MHGATIKIIDINMFLQDQVMLSIQRVLPVCLLCSRL